MKTERSHTLLRNWMSLLGIPLAAFGFVVGAGLIVLDILNPFASPYLGIFTYLIVPVILIGGLLLTGLGAWREHRRRLSGRPASLPNLPVIDLNTTRHFYTFVAVIVVAFLFFTLSGVGSYRAYHFTESVEFCGKTCHSVMKPEHTAYGESPHANVRCTECHIGPGAGWLVKSKLNGLYQVYSTMFNKYSRPIETPVHNLRPAQETCYECHWPAKFFGAVQRTRTYFAADEENTAWSLRMLINVGGGSPEHGPVEGIHWHMVGANKIEYVATDEKRLVIPWVRQTDREGNVTVYVSEDSKDDFSPEGLAKAEVRTLDCIDCHNRPTHNFHDPNKSLDTALGTGAIDPALPWVKLASAEALLAEYTTEPEAMAGIEARLRKEYPDGGANVDRAVAEVQRIYRTTFFPEMKVDWRQYPDHIGHFITPGCFRCHDNKHVSPQGRRITMDCKACHSILAQGPGGAPGDIAISAEGLDFEHPGGNDLLDGTLCSECHTGAPEL